MRVRDVDARVRARVVDRRARTNDATGGWLNAPQKKKKKTRWTDDSIAVMSTFRSY
jgi:hypothetical protein